MYFMLIRPQQRRLREQQALLSAVTEGDEIMTTAGLYGYVTAIDGDVLWVEIAEGVEVRVAKAAVAKRVTTGDGAGAVATSDAAVHEAADDELPEPAADEAR
jgi:preprotein translocase subunit YajC